MFNHRNQRGSGRKAVPVAPKEPTPPTQEELQNVEIPAAAQPKFFNLKASKPDKRDKVHAPRVKLTILPTSIDLSPQMCAPMDQGELGSCSAHALTAVLRYEMQEKLKQDFAPSRLALYYATRVYVEGEDPSNDSGCALRDACKAASQYFLLPEIYFPYDTSKYSQEPPSMKSTIVTPTPTITYASVPQTDIAIKTALYNKNPIIVGIALYESFCSATVAATGVVPMPDTTKEQCLGGHAVSLLGFNDVNNTYKLVNSWGPWGNKGYFTVPKAYLLNPNLCFDRWCISF